MPWVYDLFMEVAERFGLRRWRQRVVSSATGRVLDLGCGTGRNLRLFEAQTRVIGLELDLRLLLQARKRAPFRLLVLGRAESLPFRAGSFSTVVSSLVFCSVADPARGLSETARILVQNGELRMLEHVRSSNRVVGWIQDRVQPAWTWITGGCHPNRRTENAVEEAGFVIGAHEHPGRTTLRCFVARGRKTVPAAD